jgi:hypothetical protein
MLVVSLAVITGISGLGIVSNRIKLKSPRPAVSQTQQAEHAPNTSR